MDIHTLPCTLPSAKRRVALGIFDGLHSGHRAVLAHTLDGEERPTVFTLTGMPKAAAPLLTEQEMAHTLAQMGIADWVRADFARISTLTPAAFVDSVLCDTLHATAVCCGYNYRFGVNRSGDVALLKRLCEARNITVTVVDAVAPDGEAVSSTRIRQCIANGEMLQAARLLGYPYTITSAVEHGHQLGRKLGFPTLNQRIPDGRLLPRRGVYASAVLVNGHITYGVTNVGCRPTVHTTDTLLMETWLPDFEGDVYGQDVSVSPLYFLREEQAFSSLDALTDAVRRDGDRARQLLAGHPDDRTVKAIVFDFDDTLHNRRIAFEQFAYHLLTTYFPTWDEATRHARAHRMMIANNGGYTAGYPVYFQEFLDEWNWPDGVDAQVLTAIANRRFPEFVALFDDTVTVLTALRARGYRLGVITNGHSQMQHRKVDVAGIRALLDTVVVSGDTGIHKPDGELFRRAAAALGLPPQQCVYVGDHPVNDILGAQNGGMQPLYMDAFGQYAVSDVPRVETLTQLLALFP